MVVIRYASDITEYEYEGRTSEPSDAPLHTKQDTTTSIEK